MLKKADIGVGLYLLAAVVFFIVPIPSVLLDVMLAFNISIALMYCLFGKYWICLSSRHYFCLRLFFEFL